MPDGVSYFALCDRHALLKNLPQGGTGCEIGVFTGDNAAFLRDELQPDRLYLIDPWTLGSWDDVLAATAIRSASRFCRRRSRCTASSSR